LLSCVSPDFFNHANKAAELIAASTVSTCGRDLLDVSCALFNRLQRCTFVFRHGSDKAYRFLEEVKIASSKKQKLTKILLPQKSLLGSFYRRQ